jgi:hypothetical protein
MDEIIRLMMKISIHHLVTCFILCACSAFEKSLRNRLLKVIYSTCNCFFSYQFCNRRKMSSQDSDSLNTFLDFSQTNPDTDYHCLTTFGSFFTKDIPLPAVIFFSGSCISLLCLYTYLLDCINFELNLCREQQ